MEFVKILEGEFMMGSPSDEGDRANDEGPVHKVTIEEFYYLGKYEVTQEQWREVMGSNPSYFKGDDRFRCKKSGYFTKPVKNIINGIFICHK